MARNNTNRPRNNSSRSRNLSSFIPQSRVSITEREDITRSTDYYIDSYPWVDYFPILDMNSTSPVQSVPLELDEVFPNSNPSESSGATQISLGNGSNFWVSNEEWEAHRRSINQAIERLANRNYSNHRPRITEEATSLSLQNDLLTEAIRRREEALFTMFICGEIIRRGD